MSAQAASVTSARLSQTPSWKSLPWQVVYAVAAASAGAAVVLHLLLASPINAVVVMMLAGMALAIIPTAIFRSTTGSESQGRAVLLAHQTLFAMALYAAVSAGMHVFVLPAFAGVMALGAQIGRKPLYACALVLVAWVLVHSGGLMPWHAAVTSAASAISLSDVLIISAVLALPGLVSYLPIVRAGLADQTDAAKSEVREPAISERIFHCLPQLVLQHNRAGNVTGVYGASTCAPLARHDALLGGGLFARVHVADRQVLLHTLDRARHHPGIHRAEIRLCEPSSDTEPQSPSKPAPSPVYHWVELRTQSDVQDRVRGECADAEPLICSTLRDIHEHKVREEALELARREAELDNASKTRFLASVSHELRTPLNAIIGFSELLKMPQSEYEQMSAEKRIEYASLISESGQHLLDVVNDILDTTKIEAGRFEIQCETVDLRPIIRSAVEMSKTIAKAEQNRIDVRIDKKLPHIVADGRALKQILVNLLSNAVKFSAGAPPVRVDLSKDGNNVVLKVVDQGIGIAADDLARIGEPFFRTAAAEGLQTAGTGLGLSVVKGLVALHGGQMTITSACGEGTHVTVRLPTGGPAGHNDAAPNTDDTITTLPLYPATPDVARDVDQKLRKVG